MSLGQVQRVSKVSASTQRSPAQFNQEKSQTVLPEPFLGQCQASSQAQAEGTVWGFCSLALGCSMMFHLWGTPGYGCVCPFPRFSCWDVGWAHGVRGLGFLQVPPEAIPEEISWDGQPRGPAAPWGCLPMDTAEGREEQGWILGTKPASDTSTPGFHWVPLLIPCLHLRKQEQVIPVRNSDPGQRYWTSQSTTMSLCCHPGCSSHGVPWLQHSLGGSPFPGGFPPFQSRQQAGQRWFGYHSDSHFQGCLPGMTSLTQIPTTAIYFPPTPPHKL